MSVPWPARCPQPLGSCGDLRGAGGRRGTSGSVILSSRAAQPGHLSVGPGMGKVVPKVPATARPSRGSLSLQKTQLMKALLHGVWVGKTLPFMDGSLELREGQGRAQSHTASCGICMSLAARLLLPSLQEDLGLPPGQGSEERGPRGWVRRGTLTGGSVIACARLSCVRRESGNSSWEIPRASKAEEGTYECTAVSRAGTGRAQAQVIVTGLSLRVFSPHPLPDFSL